MPETDPLTTVVRIASIHIADDRNGRAMLDPRRVAELADALAHEPLLHPITLRRTPSGLTLVAGRHRLAAFVKLGRTEIAALVLDVDDSTEATLRLTENLARVQLSPVEQAHQLAELVNLDEKGVEAVALRLGRSVDWILDRLEILYWPEALVDHVHNKRITLTAARILAKIQPPAVRDMRIHDAATNGCSARTASYWLQTAHREDPNAPPPPVFSSHEPVYRTETTVKVICVGCAELKPIEVTQLCRWCNACLSMIESAQRQGKEMSPSLTPPTYDPPPPAQR
jgi:ParB family chromosome partitioning protein